jgi:hypothetical protein
MHTLHLLYMYTVLGELAQKFDIIPYSEATRAYVIDYKQVNTGNNDCKLIDIFNRVAHVAPN